MRKLQFKDPVKVTPESMTRGITGGIRSFARSAGRLPGREHGSPEATCTERRPLSIIFSNFCADFLDPNAIGSKLRRLKEGSGSRCRKNSRVADNPVGKATNAELPGGKLLTLKPRNQTSS
jgi:hypothetical protein